MAMATSGCQRSLFELWQLVKPNHNLQHCVQHLAGRQKPNPMPSTLHLSAPAPDL